MDTYQPPKTPIHSEDVIIQYSRYKETTTSLREHRKTFFSQYVYNMPFKDVEFVRQKRKRSIRSNKSLCRKDLADLEKKGYLSSKFDALPHAMGRRF